MRLRFDVLYWTELLHEFSGKDHSEILNLYRKSDEMCWDYAKTLDMKSKKEQLKYYNRFELLCGYVNWHLHVAFTLRKRLADKLYGRVLDYGCGIATQSLMANVERGVAIELYDIDTTTKGFLKYVIEKHNLANIKFVDFQHSTGYYDCIVCTDVLEHLDDPLHILQQFKVKLAKSGKLFVRAPFDNTQDPTHHLCIKTIEELLAEAGIARDNYEVVSI